MHRLTPQMFPVSATDSCSWSVASIPAEMWNEKIGLRFSSSWNVCHVYSSDVNKDLEPKAKDTGHKAKAKAKALGYQGQSLGLGSQGQGLGSQGQGQGLEMSRPITKTEGHVRT